MGRPVSPLVSNMEVWHTGEGGGTIEKVNIPPATGYWLLATGYRLLAIGYWLQTVPCFPYRAAISSTATAYGSRTPYSAAMRKNPRIPSTHSSSST